MSIKEANLPPTPAFVLASDVHIARGAWKQFPQVQGDSFFALEQLVDYANHYGVPLVLAGDTVDEPTPGSAVIERMIRTLEPLENNPLYYILGQPSHDGPPPSWLSLYSNSRYLHGIAGQVGPFQVAGLDYRPSHLLRPLLETTSFDADILLTHQVWKDFLRRGDMPALDEVRGVRAIFTGDYHRHGQGVLSSNVIWASPGSTSVMALDEEKEKHCFLVYDDLSLQSLWLRVRHVHYPDPILDRGQLEQVVGVLRELREDTTGLPEEVRAPLIVIRYDPSVSGVEHEITQVLHGQPKHLFFRPTTPRRVDTPIAPIRSWREVLAEECPDPQTQQDVLAVTAGPIENELNRMEEECISPALNQRTSVT